MSEAKPIEYKGAGATVRWYGSLCIHIGECGRAKNELFVAGRKPWCDPGAAERADVKDVVERCPTGALTVEFEDGADAETAAAENTVHVVYNGPLFFRGALQIVGAPEGAPGLEYRAALCRCGASKNKPFCDNSHLADKFEDYGAVGETGGAVQEIGGPLNVTPIKNGPLMVEGNVSLIASGGRTAWHGKRAALCRCGASNNKPFCDGQHAKIGFVSE